MKDFNMWCKGISVITIISGMMIALIPNSKLTSAFKALVATIILLFFLNPVSSLLNNETDFFLHSSNAVKEDDTVALAEYAIINCAEDIAEQKISNFLKENSISAQCRIEISATENKAVIEKINISGNLNEETKNRVKNYIEETFPSVTLIEFSG